MADTQPVPRPASPGPGTVVIDTLNCEVILTDYGFYARCTRCPYISEYTPAKFRARRWAGAHDEDQPGDHAER